MTHPSVSWPLLTVCIPAYNRAHLLGPLLESILSQDFDDYEILICEDESPERKAIAEVVLKYQKKYSRKIHYEENPINLGYDGNIRQLVERARGQYCVFMGNDDLLCAGALRVIASVIQRQPDCGVVVRSYATFEQTPGDVKQVFRYFPQEYKIPAGAKAISTAYRRSVVISGMVIHRESALAVATSRFDGTLLYQLYLVGMILGKRSVVFSPQIIALRRDGIAPDFGNSASEKGKFVPRERTPESSLGFMRGMFAIARYVEKETRLDVFSNIRADIGNYSYSVLSIQAKRPVCVFVKYGLNLAGLGLWQYPLFYLYFVMLLLIGPDRSDGIIGRIKRQLGHTPRFGAV